MPTEKIEKTPNIVQTPALTKTVSIFKKIAGFAGKKKKLSIAIAVLLLLLVSYRIISLRNQTAVNAPVKSLIVQVNKNFDFPALNNNGKSSGSKVNLKIVSAEKTSQVQVKDQVFSAKNNKMFLIVNLELKNDSTASQNLLTGDLVRLTVSGNEDTKFAPDLHNNLVLIAPISTKLDRIGFVIPQEAKDFKLYLGELEGKKEVISIAFPS